MGTFGGDIMSSYLIKHSTLSLSRPRCADGKWSSQHYGLSRLLQGQHRRQWHPLYVNVIINGGSHAGNKPVFKEYFVVTSAPAPRTMKLKQALWGVRMGHRNREMEDTFIADMAMGLCTVQI